MTNKCIVVNSSVVIVLVEINLLNILVRLYEEVVVPKAVYREVVVKGRSKPGSQKLETLVHQNRVRLLALRSRMVVEALHDPLGLGEAEAIVLALGLNADLLLVDEHDVRKAQLKS